MNNNPVRYNDPSGHCVINGKEQPNESYQCKYGGGTGDNSYHTPQYTSYRPAPPKKKPVTYYGNQFNLYQTPNNTYTDNILPITVFYALFRTSFPKMRGSDLGKGGMSTGTDIQYFLERNLHGEIVKLPAGTDINDLIANPINGDLTHIGLQHPDGTLESTNQGLTAIKGAWETTNITLVDPPGGGGSVVLQVDGVPGAMSLEEAVNGGFIPSDMLRGGLNDSLEEFQ